MKTRTPKQILTARQKEVLGFIASFIKERRYPPCVRDIMEGIGVVSPNGVVGHLNALEAKGWIGIDRGIARAIWIED